MGIKTYGQNHIDTLGLSYRNGRRALYAVEMRIRIYPQSEYGGKRSIILGAPFLNGLNSVFDADRNSISSGNLAL